jgi:polysaccharide biosynthesis transport protein
MTFRQALAVIWRKRLLIVATMVLAVVAAGVFIAMQTPVYTSVVSTRFSSLAAGAASSGQIGTATVDFDPSSITSSQVLQAAATEGGEPAGSAGAWAVTFSTGQASADSKSLSVAITANASTPALAQKRAGAVATAYNAYLEGQTALARTAAEAQVAKWTAQAQAEQELVDRNPSDSISQSALAAAISSLSDANGTIQSIDNAGRPLIITIPAAPGAYQGVSLWLAVLVALVAGLIAGMGIALIWDAFDDRLRADDDVEEITGVPALGELSLDQGARRGRDRLPAAGSARTPVNEGLRSLRTTLQVLLPPQSAVVLITSVEPADGKSFVSSNLALTWSRMGRRVVLVGGDLRNAGLEGYFGETADGPGLTELLQEASASGTAPTDETVEAFLRDSPYAGLRILPSGDEPWDPADLLARDAVDDIVDSLRRHADVVIIDSPPSFGLVDARLLAAHADGVVVVAGLGRTRRAPLEQTVQALATSGAAVLGVVVNRSRRPLPKSYTAYYGDSRPLRARDDEFAEDEVVPAEEIEVDDVVVEEDEAPAIEPEAEETETSHVEEESDVDEEPDVDEPEAGEPDADEPEELETDEPEAEEPGTEKAEDDAPARTWTPRRGPRGRAARASAEDEKV